MGPQLVAHQFAPEVRAEQVLVCFCRRHAFFRVEPSPRIISGKDEQLRRRPLHAIANRRDEGRPYSAGPARITRRVPVRRGKEDLVFPAGGHRL